jgi:tetratricopeptide (TPR) repeat protein
MPVNPVVEAAAPPGTSSRFQRKKPSAVPSVVAPSSSSSITSSKQGGTHDLSSIIGSDTSISNEEEVCEQLLVGGFVQSYVDFYHLTHRVDPNAGGDATVKLVTSPKDMKFIRDNLIQAELSRRQGNTAGVYAAYNRLADFYVSMLDWRTSIFFHEKCLEVAQLTTDMRAEMSANHALGCVYQKMNDYDSARKCHERHEAIANEVDVLEEVGKASMQLYKVYMVLANRLDNENKFDEALEMYHHALDATKKCWDKGSECEVNGKIGNLLLQVGQAKESISFLQQQKGLSADMGFAEGRCRACSSLAQAYDLLNKPEKALQELTLVHTISEQAGDVTLQCEAAKALGTLYSKVGKLEEAVEALQKHFTLLKVVLSKQSSSPSPYTPTDLELARVYVGISKGNLLMGAYVVNIQTNFTKLLDWKLNRTDLR